MPGVERAPWREKLTSKAAWADAASYTMADVTMLRKELVIGYAVAGVLAVMVPMHVWNDVFLAGHGFCTSGENVIVGPSPSRRHGRAAGLIVEGLFSVLGAIPKTRPRTIVTTHFQWN